MTMTRISINTEIMGLGDGSATGGTTYKQSAPRSRQITTPTPHHSIFSYRPDALHDAQPTVWKNWRKLHTHNRNLLYWHTARNCNARYKNSKMITNNKSQEFPKPGTVFQSKLNIPTINRGCICHDMSTMPLFGGFQLTTIVKSLHFWIRIVNIYLTVRWLHWG